MCLLDTATSRISSRSGTIPVGPAVIILAMNIAMDATRRNACICISDTLVLEFPRWVSFFFVFLSSQRLRTVELSTIQEEPRVWSYLLCLVTFFAFCHRFYVLFVVLILSPSSSGSVEYS